MVTSILKLFVDRAAFIVGKMVTIVQHTDFRSVRDEILKISIIFESGLKSTKKQEKSIWFGDARCW